MNGLNTKQKVKTVRLERKKRSKYTLSTRHTLDGKTLIGLKERIEREICKPQPLKSWVALQISYYKIDFKKIKVTKEEHFIMIKWSYGEKSLRKYFDKEKL